MYKPNLYRYIIYDFPPFVNHNSICPPPVIYNIFYFIENNTWFFFQNVIEYLLLKIFIYKSLAYGTTSRMYMSIWIHECAYTDELLDVSRTRMSVHGWDFSKTRMRTNAHEWVGKMLGFMGFWELLKVRKQVHEWGLCGGWV